MKIAHVVAPARFGGLEQVVRALVTLQTQSGREVTLVALLEPGVPEPALVTEVRNRGARVVAVIFPARSFFKQRRSLLSISRELQPDVLHTHGYLPDVISASLGRGLTAARVSTVHGFTVGTTRNRLYEWLQRRSYARFDAVVAVSSNLGDQLTSQRFACKKIHVVQNAFAPSYSVLERDNARTELNLYHHDFTIGWVGRLSPEKAADLMIDALAQLRDIAVRLAFIGGGREWRSLEQRARELGLEDRVSWIGEITDAGRYFKAFDVFVNSSRTEGTPITVFEAMYSEVPIVATAVGGVPDVVSGREAMLVPSGDASALAAAIRDVHDHPDASSARAARAKSRLRENFALGPWLEAYDRIYREALSSRNP